MKNSLNAVPPTHEGHPNELERNADESQAAYLARAGTVLTKIFAAKHGGMLFDPANTHEEEYSPEEMGLIAHAIQEAGKETPTSATPDNTAAIETIRESIGVQNKNPKDEPGFDQTRRDRGFFGSGEGSGRHRHETYWTTLFFPYRTKSTLAFAKTILEGRTVVLLGGGGARLGEEMRQAHNINPASVLNIDPFVSQPAEGSDPVVSMSAADVRLVEKMRTTPGFKGVSEVWAVFSVPAYLQNPEDIKALFKNIDALLDAEGGHARIWPIEVQSSGTETEVEARKTALIEALRELDACGNYEISPFRTTASPGFTLRKLQKHDSSL